MTASAEFAVMAPHRFIMGVIFMSALAASVAILPGANERVAMLESDGHSREALKILEAEYGRGDRRYRTLYQMQALYEDEGEVSKSRELLEAMVEQRPRDAVLRSRLAKFYRNTGDATAYVRALTDQIAVKYSESACRELVALLRSQGQFAGEQAALQQCRQKGYRRPEDLSRLAELMAADGDSIQAAAILRSIDDLLRLKTSRERYVLLTLLLDQDQPKEAERRATRWIRATKDDGLSLGLIDVFARSRFPSSAMEVAKETGAPGDSISLTVAERLIEQSQTGAAQLYLKGWLEKAAMTDEQVAIRFIDAALSVDDPKTAANGARKFGLEHLNPPLLLRLAEDLANSGFAGDAEQFRRIAGVEIGPPADAGDDVTATGDLNRSGPQAAPSEADMRAAPQGHFGVAGRDSLEAWRRSLWAKMSEDASRRAQALGLSPAQTDAAGRGRSRAEGHGGASSKLLRKTSKVLQHNSRIKMLKHKHRAAKDLTKPAPPAPAAPPQKPGAKPPPEP